MNKFNEHSIKWPLQGLVLRNCPRKKFKATNYSLNDVFLLDIMNVTNELSLNDIPEERENAAGP